MNEQTDRLATALLGVGIGFLIFTHGLGAILALLFKFGLVGLAVAAPFVAIVCLARGYRKLPPRIGRPLAAAAALSIYGLTIYGTMSLASLISH